MSTSRRTRLVAPLLALLLGGGVVACGEESSGGQDPTGVSAGGGLDQLEVSGDFGSEPTLDWKDAVTVDQTQSETLVEGEGAEVASGDLVLAHILLANGVDQQVLTSDFSAEPQLFAVSDQLIPALRDQLEGATIGSRIAVAAPPKDAFGEQGNPQMGIGNKDTVVFVLDVTDVVPAKPSGSQQEPAAWMPELQQSDGVPSGMKFSGTPKPTTNLRSGTLITGEGKKVTAGDTLYVNYLGQVYGGKEPFDQSFSQGQPFSFTLGQGEVVKGWDQALAGVPVGSRVLISVPPALGYGKKGQGDIKGTDTMYFVIDVLAAR